MASLRMRLSLVILSLLFPVPHSFVIRKRSVNYDLLTNNDQHPSSDWIIDRPRESMRDPYAGKYGALDGERLALELLLEHPEEDYVDEDEEEEDRLRMIPEKYDDDDDEGGEDVRIGGTAKLVDKSELEDLFQAEKKKKTPDVERGNSKSAESELTKEDVERLLSPGSKGDELRKIVTETKIVVSSASSVNGSEASAPSYQGVRVVEVAEKDSNGATRRQKQTEWLTTPDQDKNDGAAEQATWLGDVLGKEDVGQNTPTRKVKRSEMSTGDVLVGGRLPSNVDEDDEEEEKEDVELLKAYIRLQTEENRHLEKALNLAITTQMGESDEFLGDEVGQLRMAVRNEEALETIRNAIRGRRNEEEEEEDDEDDDDSRSSQEEEEEDENAREEEEREISRQLLKAKLKKFIIDSAVDDMSDGDGYGDDDNDDEEEVVEDQDGALVGQEDEDRSTLEQYRNSKSTVLNPFTRNALVEYGTNKRSPLGLSSEIELEPDSLSDTTNDLDIIDLLGTPDETELGYCPAVRELTDDCQAARAEGLVLDAEAVSLCNRHQICYYCGSVFGMTSDSCDGGYLGESEQLCLGEEKCTKEAAGLYLIMAKTHQFIQSPKQAPYICASACVYDYVIGLADDRR